MMRKHEKKHMKVLTGMFKSNMILSVGRALLCDKKGADCALFGVSETTYDSDG